MTSTSQKPSELDNYDDEIDIRVLFRILWLGKWLIAGITSAVVVIAIVMALLLPNIYRAEALLAPNDKERAGGMSAMASQYSGLASLAGINMGDGKADQVALGLEVLKSRKFISEFVERHNILVPLIAAKNWDSESGELMIEPDDYDTASGEWVRRVRPPRKIIPSAQEAYEKFMDILSVDKDNKTGFVTVAVEHFSPVLAKQWVDWLIEDLNASVMRQDVIEAEKAIEYLNEQIENTSLSELRNVLFSLIEEQTKIVMLAKVTDEYLLKTLDPAIVPEMKSNPKRSFIVLLSALLGGFFSVIVVLGSHSLFR